MVVTGVSPELVMVTLNPGGGQTSHPHGIIHVQVSKDGRASLKMQ